MRIGVFLTCDSSYFMIYTKNKNWNKSVISGSKYYVNEQ